MFKMKKAFVIFSILTYIYIFECAIDFKLDDKIANTVDGRPCWTNCRAEDGKPKHECIADDSLQYVECLNTAEDAPLYYTSKGKPCLSLCVPDDNTTGRCIVSQDMQWENCDANFPTQWVKHQYTESYGPCKDTCRKDGSDYKCNGLYYEVLLLCEPHFEHHYVQARTINKQCECKGVCKKHEIQRFENDTWCLTNGECGDGNICALPALPRPHKMDEQIQELLKVKKPVCLLIEKGIKEDGLRGTYLQQLAIDLENYPFFDRVRILEENNPVQSFTSRLEFPYNWDESRITRPTVMRAQILPKHLRADVMDENTHAYYQRIIINLGLEMLIPYRLGGPVLSYNAIPRSKCDKTFGDKAWARIAEHVQGQGNPKVEILIVMLHKDEETNPSGTIQQVLYYEGNNIIDEVYQYIPSVCTDGPEFNISSLGPNSLLPSVHGLAYNGKYDDCHVFSDI